MNNPLAGLVRRPISFLLALLVLFALSFFARALAAQGPVTNDPPQYGPYNGVFLAGGDGLKAPLDAHDTVLRADSPWTFYCWVRTAEPLQAMTLLAGIGETTEEYPRYIGADAHSLFLWMGQDNSLTANVSLAPAQWHFLAATFDGQDFHLYSDGAQVASGALVLGSVSPVIQLAPPPPALLAKDGVHFGGRIASLVLLRQALSAGEIKQLYDKPDDFSILEFEEGSKSWPVQTHGQAGYRAPQDPSTMPVSKAPFSAPVAQPVPAMQPALQASGANTWTIAGGWRLSAAPDVKADGAAIAQPGFDAAHWLPAVVPGTVLTTYIARGIYPDPEYGLNNLAIPESLNKQDYWYRTEIKAPETIRGSHLTLTFQGINYKAVVWLNGHRLGTITGAFIRGVFDVTGIWKTGKGESNVLAVQVSPPPHPGIPQEQSIKGGPGENGGIMCLDGPTFVASEGWDWIPGIRDRETGIWQSVELTATESVKIGDPQVVTTLPLPDISRADVVITVPLDNASDAPVHGTLQASFESVNVVKEVTLPPGPTTLKLTPAEFKQLTVQQPRLWWPNGYGKQELYHLKLTFNEGTNQSDTKLLRFGIREITYELSLLDSAGHLRRVEVAPALGKEGDAGVVDVTHEGMRQIPAADPMPPNLPEAWRANWHSWVGSLAPGAESSPAVRMSDDTGPSPYLVIKVNGVRIACRGGNWGMDDLLKRVSRERLEPYFRLHHDAHLNIIRNWVGQNTEETFYDLADEYGLLIWNDFWETTQNYNIEAEDPALFLANARDTILRYRNHPSIAVWCGRNEGVPQPILNKGLADLVNSLDGTRYYSPSSNQINLQNSGPYKYMDPKLYFTTLNHGFSVETGTPSMSTLESFRSTTPKADQWPMDDVWAYHDWHFSGNGDIAPFMAEIQAEFGAPASLEDFERKAQMLNYVDHRAIFEGMNAHLWAPNSGRMLWMTQPAWPSTMWQIFSHDYDTQASYYGTKKACEPLHIQLDLSSFEVAVVNTTTASVSALSLDASVYSLDNRLLLHHQEQKDAGADSLTAGFKLDLAPLFTSGVVLVKLELHDSTGQLVSQNLYWLAAESSGYRDLDRLPPAQVSASADSARTGDTIRVRIQLKNDGSAAALQNKLTLLNADGTRILPAYLSDNYISLLPGESREVQIEYPASAGTGAAQVSLRGWNLAPETIHIAAGQ
ncbi:MAG: LamG-like jellyroll fold domain-containing protein [Candidatus Acidiferrales bacterium]